MSSTHLTICDNDRDVLLRLAERVRAIADSPRNQEIRRQWYLHDECKAERPLILTETDGGITMVKPDLQLECQEEWARGQEHALRSTIIHVETIADDTPVEPYVHVGWNFQFSDFGIPFHQTEPDGNGTRGASHIDPVITDLDKDFHKLKPRTFCVNRKESQDTYLFLKEFYSGILDVRMRGNPWWTMGLTNTAVNFIGLESLMMSMYDQPEGLHRLMAFLRDDRLALLNWLEREGLLTLNNENDYIGSGSRGYTKKLPRNDRTPDSAARACDIWTLLESQETVGVGPEHYAEFIFPYENAVAEKAGRVYYGCCEPVNTRWHILKHMHNLHRLSISPWCDQQFMAQELGSRYGYSRKPNPSMISTDVFDEKIIYRDLEETMLLAKQHGCSLEIVMKDVHTLNGEPDRLTRWVAIARAAAERVYS